MAEYTIKQSGGNFSSINGFIGDGGTNAGDVGNIEGTWSSADTTAVTWNKAVTVKANDSSSKQAGRPWKSGDTTYRHIRTGSGHAFTCTANVDLRDITIHSDTTGTSDEIFRADSNYTTHTVKNCHLGFDNGNSQNDVIYVDSSGAPATITFEQCFFYAVERSIVDDYQAGEDYTINFNCCASYDIGGSGSREDGCWFGILPSGNPTITINMQGCLCAGIQDTNVINFAYSVDGTFTVNADGIISETSQANFVDAEDTANYDSNCSWSVTFVTGNPAAGQVGLEDITTAPYDPRLYDDADNIAIDVHSTGTGANSGLVIPSTDIVGTSRPQNTDYEIGLHEISSGTGPSGHPWFYRWSGLSVPIIGALLAGNPNSSRRGFLKSLPFWWMKP